MSGMRWIIAGSILGGAMLMRGERLPSASAWRGALFSVPPCSSSETAAWCGRNSTTERSGRGDRGRLAVLDGRHRTVPARRREADVSNDCRPRSRLRRHPPSCLARYDQWHGRRSRLRRRRHRAAGRVSGMVGRLVVLATACPQRKHFHDHRRTDADRRHVDACPRYDSGGVAALRSRHGPRERWPIWRQSARSAVSWRIPMPFGICRYRWCRCMPISTR